MRKAVFMVLAVIGLGVVAIGCGGGGEGGGSDSGGTIKIGELEPLTGSAAIYGLSNQKAVEMAVEEVNEAGGLEVDGEKRKVEVKSLDDECDPEAGTAAFQRLVSQEETHLIVGTTCSDVAEAYKPLLESTESLSVVTGASDPGIADPPYMFQYRANTGEYGDAYLEAVEKQIKPKTVAILLDQTHTGWVATKPKVVAALKEMGIKIVDEEEYKHNDTDFYTQLTSIKASNPDLIMTMGGYANDDAKIWEQAHQLGIDADILTQLAGTTADYTELVNPSVAEGIYGVATPTMSDFETEGYKPAVEFGKEFQKKKGEEVGFTTLSAYSGFFALLKAIQNAKTTETAAVAKALEEMKAEELEQKIEPVVASEGGKLFAKSGNADFDVLLKQWQGGKLVEVEEYK